MEGPSRPQISPPQVAEASQPPLNSWISQRSGGEYDTENYSLSFTSGRGGRTAGISVRRFFTVEVGRGAGGGGGGWRDMQSACCPWRGEGARNPPARCGSVVPIPSRPTVLLPPSRTPRRDLRETRMSNTAEYRKYPDVK